MILKIKILVTWLLNLFGIGIYFISDKKPDLSVEWLDNIYRTKKHDLSKKRLYFYDEIIKILISYNITLNNKTILDIGCGDGRMLKTISEYYTPRELIGIDISQEAIRLTKELIPSATIKTHDILETNNINSDIVLCIEVLEHIADIDTALENIKDCVLPNGTLLIIIPNGRLDTWEGHINFWSIVSWQHYMSKHLPNSIIGTTSHNRHLYAIWRKDV